MHAMAFDPEESQPGSHCAWKRVEFRHLKGVLIPVCTISGLNTFNLSIYGLHARYPTLKVKDHSSSSKGLLLGGWPILTEAGFAPARIRDLARPHSEVVFLIDL